MKRTLKIRCDRVVATDARIWLNGFEISEMVSGLTLDMQVGEANSLTLHIIPGEIDIDAETLAVLQAHVKVES